MDTRQVKTTPLVVADWGLTDYSMAFERQAEMVKLRLAGANRDTLVLVEHPATVTLGRRATDSDLCLPERQYSEEGIILQKINRGGLATAHEPGQLVAYPVVELKIKDVRWFAQGMLEIVIQVLNEFEVAGYLKTGEPGVWVNGKKICSFGIALKKWVSSHGIAFNVNNSLTTFATIVPCGRPAEIVTSLSRELDRPVDIAHVKTLFVEFFCKQFHYSIEAHVS